MITDLLTGPLKMKVPPYQRVEMLSENLTAVTPAEFQADGVVAYYATPDAERPAFAVVFEAQRKPDLEKRLSWPVYVATTHARHDCPTMLIVWCESRAVARWAAEPISTGDPGLKLTPVAVGPDQIPVLGKGPYADRFPELMFLSAVAHQNGKHRGKVLDGFLSVIDLFENSEAKKYTATIAALATATTRSLLEDMMTVDLTWSEWAELVLPKTTAKNRAEGKAEGKAESLFVILGARGIAVPDDVRERIAACTDPAQLDTWTARAATAMKIDELFD